MLFTFSLSFFLSTLSSLQTLCSFISSFLLFVVLLFLFYEDIFSSLPFLFSSKIVHPFWSIYPKIFYNFLYALHYFIVFLFFLFSPLLYIIFFPITQQLPVVLFLPYVDVFFFIPFLFFRILSSSSSSCFHWYFYYLLLFHFLSFEVLCIISCFFTVYL